MLGLVIWGLFYVLMMVVEVSAVSSLVGSLMGIATSGIRATYKAATAIFTKSPEDRVVNAAERIGRDFRDEVVGDVGDVKKQIEKYIKDLKPANLTAEQVRDEVMKLFTDVEIHAIRHQESPYDEETVLKFMEKNKKLTGENAKTAARGVKEAFSKIREEASTDKSTADKVTDSAMRVAGLSPEQTREYRSKFEEYLRATGKENLQPETIKRDLEKLFTHPKQGWDALKAHLGSIDRDTITNVLTQRRDMNPNEARGTVDKIYSVIEKMRGGADRAKEMAGQAVGSVKQMAGSPQQDLDTARSGMMDKIRDYVERLDTPRLDVDAIAEDFKGMFSHPKESIADLSSRLGSIDRETIVAMLAQREDISQSDAERIVAKYESVRDSIKNKANEAMIDVKYRATAMKDEAVHQVDEARKTAATAAWWVLGSAVVSGIAAVIGGIVAASTGYNL